MSDPDEVTIIGECQKSKKKLYIFNYHKNPKISDTQTFAVITLKVEQDGFSLEKCIQNMQRELQTV